jgi:hypothetical protein
VERERHVTLCASFKGELWRKKFASMEMGALLKAWLFVRSKFQIQNCISLALLERIFFTSFGIFSVEI